MTPEARARQSIDALIVVACWAVQDLKQANIHAALGVVIREFQLNVGHGFTDLLPRVYSKRVLMGWGLVSRISSGYTTSLNPVVFKIGLATNAQ